MNNLELLKNHPKSIVVLILISTIVGSIITGVFTNKEALINNSPDLAKIGAEIIQKNNELLANRLAIVEKQVNSLLDERELLRKERVLLLSKIKLLEANTTEKFNNLKALQSFAENMPGPVWMKDTKFRILFINEAYTKNWNVSNWQYVGRKDEAIWSQEFSENYRITDQKVLDCRCAIKIKQKMPEYTNKPISDKNKLITWEVWKWPITKDGAIFGIAGAAFK